MPTTLCQLVFFPLNSPLKLPSVVLEKKQGIKDRSQLRVLPPQAKGITHLARSPSLVQVPEPNAQAFDSLTYFLLFSSRTQGMRKLHQSPGTPAPFMTLSYGLRLFLGFHFYSTGTHMRTLRPYTDIIFSLKPSWTRSFFWLPIALGPCFIISTVPLPPRLAHESLRQ